MSTRPPRDSSDEEIEAFAGVCDQLAGFDARLSPEWIDGYLSALAGGPRAPSLDECLPTMTGDVFDRVFADPEDRERALAALRRRFAVIADQLDGEQLDDDPDRLRLAPYMIEWTDEARAAALEAGEVDAAQAQQLVTGGDWADGFFEALQRHEAHFQADAGEDDVAAYLERLQQVHVLRLALDSDELARHLKATYGDEGADRARLVDEACYAVQDMRLWWADHLPRPETRRTGKTPGRNDPCPCGSGKKYKKCHGA